MMNKLYSGLIAFSMYSKIPVPMTEWTRERMKYVMCWFPLVGAAEGLFFWLWFYAAGRLGFGTAASGLIGTALPLLITGGIHMDGFLDTMDAKSSYGSKEKKLEILKDPHTGAFAIISCCVYFLLYAGFLTEFPAELTGLLSLCFVSERAFSGMSVVLLPCAKSSGLAAAFQDGAHKRNCRRILGIWLAVCLGSMAYRYEITGIMVFTVQAAVFYYYKRMSEKQFGGITGDLAGYFLQVCELASVAAIVTLAKIW